MKLFFNEESKRNAVKSVSNGKDFPEELEQMCEYLKNERVHLSHLTPDGRLNSAIDERSVLSAITKGFNYVSVPDGKSRKWYDFSFYDKNGNFVPVNVKISDLSSPTSDNVSSKMGLYYAVTGLLPLKDYEWDVFWDKLKEGMDNDSEDADYYFLVINKNDVSDVFCTSLKHLTSVTTNGNNIPFQCNWSANRIPTYRDNDEAKKFLVEAFGESVKKDRMAINYYRVFGE